MNITAYSKKNSNIQEREKKILNYRHEHNNKTMELEMG